ncbi:DNA/RNA helicase domain-containing protein [Staphylococcus aureus]|uniref:DNA/RNA helicase domain-containing protein n=2 Tax=Staphylococcus aureus TaxID=1280 RepID=UPI00301B899E
MESFSVNCFNLDSYLTIYNMDNNDMMSSFLKITDDYYRRLKNVKISKENDDLFCLSELLSEKLSVKQKSGYFLGYKINSKIDEEFDLLRFSEENILNIELKNSMPKGGIESIEDQLRRHKFILSILNKRVISYTFISDDKKFYKIDNNDNFIESTVDDLVESISENYLQNNELLDIDVNKFIISPYSEDDEFLNHEYYLSQNQKQIKNEIKNCTQNKIFVRGHAGTGKSLLLFDLAKEFHNQGKKVLLLFCGQLSNKYYLTDKFGFKISEISSYRRCLEDENINNKELDEADIIFIDEAQRIYDKQYRNLLKKFPEKKIFFAYDPKQILAKSEKYRFEILLKEYNNDKHLNKFVELKQKIRTNNEMIAFIDRILDLSARGHKNYNYKNINLTYFSTKEDAIEFIRKLEEEHYQCIELTQYLTRSTSVLKRKYIYNASLDVHKVIGREFEKVVVIIDQHFFYDNEGKLNSDYMEYYPYLEPEGIYQALTRVKKQLHIVIINNPNVYIEIQKIMTRKFDKT